MDNGIFLAVALVVAFGAGALVLSVVRRSMPEGQALELAAVVAAIRAQLGGVVTEERVRLLAAALYDEFGYGSKYVDRGAFCQLAWELVSRSLSIDDTATAAASMASTVYPTVRA